MLSRTQGFNLIVRSTPLFGSTRLFKTVWGKGENGGHLYFLHFPPCFLPFKKIYHLILILPSTDALKLGRFANCSQLKS